MVLDIHESIIPWPMWLASWPHKSAEGPDPVEVFSQARGVCQSVQGLFNGVAGIPLVAVTFSLSERSLM